MIPQQRNPSRIVQGGQIRLTGRKRKLNTLRGECRPLAWSTPTVGPCSPHQRASQGPRSRRRSLRSGPRSRGASTGRAGPASSAGPRIPLARLRRSSCGREGGFRRRREGPRGRVRGAASPRAQAAGARGRIRVSWRGSPLQTSCLETPMDGEAWPVGSQRVGHC